MHIGIIGGGFSGCMLAVHIARQAPAGTTLTIIEADERFGRGAAYGTDKPEHLLNVRAENMGAFPDNPNHFHAWLTSRAGGAAPAALEFVPRLLYGEYVADVFETALAAAGGRVRINLVAAVATGVGAAPQPTVSLADGRRLGFDRLALCFGNLPPADAPGVTSEARTSGLYFGDPWRAARMQAIPRDAEVLIVGSGLTMADVIQSLCVQGHSGAIKVVSRHGLLPLRHELPKPYRMEKPHGTLRQMMRRVRLETEAAAEHGHDWRDVIDALRPVTSELWQELSRQDRRRFVRHLRPLWEVHRHRLPPDVADTIAALRAAGRLSVTAGLIQSIALSEGRLRVAFQPRGGDAVAVATPNFVVNCTGPQSDYTKAADPLIRDMIAGGVIRPDDLRLGLDVTGEGAVIDLEGRTSSAIFALGPPTRGAFWEITAVPDIRRQCARLAAVLLRL